MMRKILVGSIFIAAVVAAPLGASLQTAFAQTPAKADKESIERGRYLVKIAGCNDCHTNPNFRPPSRPASASAWRIT